MPTISASLSWGKHGIVRLSLATASETGTDMSGCVGARSEWPFSTLIRLGGN
jgi:hypothetical protein